MAQIPGTNVAAMVVPFDDQDIFATHNDKYGRGGFRVCDTLADRDAITALRRKAGMWVKCLEDDKMYELGAGLSNTDWVEVPFSSGTGDLTYVHTQGVATTDWVITHNLGKRPSVVVIDSNGDEVEGEIVYNSVNQMTVIFAVPFSGTAYLN